MAKETSEDGQTKRIRLIRGVCQRCGCPHDDTELCMVEVMKNNLAVVAKENTPRVSG